MIRNFAGKVQKNEPEKKKILVNTHLNNYTIEGTTIVRSKEMAQKVIKILYQNKDKIHAWDTETIGIDAKEESPVGKGQIICASCFCGPEIDFGHGPSIFGKS